MAYSRYISFFQNEISQKQCAEALAVRGVFSKIQETIFKYAFFCNANIAINTFSKSI